MFIYALHKVNALYDFNVVLQLETVMYKAKLEKKSIMVISFMVFNSGYTTG